MTWYARRRSRVATGLVLTSPGIPMLFMGQEFLEDKPWHNDPAREDLLLDWAGSTGRGPMRDFLRFTRELCRLRRRHPALRGGKGSTPISITTATASSPSSAGSRRWGATWE